MLLKNPLEHFIKKAKARHGNKFDYSLVEYNGAKVNVYIICPIHGRFQQTPYKHHTTKHACPACENQFAHSHYDHMAVFKNKLSAPTKNGCIEWLGHLNTTGYGIIVVNRKPTVTHRFSWELVNGKIHAGLFCLHKCDNRKCVNIDHLFLGTLSDNAIDMYKKGRGYLNKKGSNKCKK